MNIAIFCGSSLGSNPQFEKAAKDLGQYLACEKVGIVYGGGKVGLMGVIADAALTAGGSVTGVIPQALKEREIAHPNLTALHTVSDMHTRKAKMAELADAFVALPGGAGTLEEFFEVWTWAQLGYHQKPCALYNADGYFSTLLEFIEEMTQSQFLKPAYKEMIQLADTPGSLLKSLRQYEAPRQKWT